MLGDMVDGPNLLKDPQDGDTERKMLGAISNHAFLTLHDRFHFEIPSREYRIQRS